MQHAPIVEEEKFVGTQEESVRQRGASQFFLECLQRVTVREVQLRLMQP
jgi:hypothetical protein